MSDLLKFLVGIFLTFLGIFTLGCAVGVIGFLFGVVSAIFGMAWGLAFAMKCFALFSGCALLLGIILIVIVSASV